MGNRLWIVENDVPTYYTYDAANELLTEDTPWSAAAPGCVAYYRYDGHGNTIARAVDGGDTGLSGATILISTLWNYV